MVSSALSGLSPLPFSRSAETGRSVALASSRQWWIIASKPTSPSRRPREKAKPALVVASALKPNDASSLAVPMSQGLGMTNAPAASCSARKVLPLSMISSRLAMVLSLILTIRAGSDKHSATPPGNTPDRKRIARCLSRSEALFIFPREALERIGIGREFRCVLVPAVAHCDPADTCLRRLLVAAIRAARLRRLGDRCDDVGIGA